MRKVFYLDVRSPREFLHSHIPRALNFPVLSDEEHQEIGTLYRFNTFDAKIKGSTYICKNIATFLQNCEIFHPKNKLFLYCARGGQRSKSFWSILKEIGFDCERLDGGYKAYRTKVLDSFSKKPKQAFITLYGLTGSGKTDLIQMAQDWSINLEGLSRHYGSSFGNEANKFLGQPSNAMFENELYEELCQKKEVILIEGESKKLGNVVIPSLFFEAFHSGYKVLIRSSIENRIERIVKMYSQIKEENFLSSMQKIQPYIQKTYFQDILLLWEQKNYQKVAEILLVKYYDKVYRQKDYDAIVDADCLQEAYLTLCAMRDRQI